MRTLRVWFGFVAASSLLASRAFGEAPRVHARLTAALPATGPQAREQSLGVAGTAMLELPLSPKLGVGVELGAITLGDGKPPEDPAFADAGATSGMSGALAAHVRPLATRDAGARRWYSGLWGGPSIGVMRTNSLIRLMGELNVGLDFPVGDQGFAAGPNLGWVHVFQPDDEVRPEDANLLTVGVHAVFDAASRAPEDLDPDRDGVETAKDRCPTVAEDRDGVKDDDGCPDDDDDHDGVLDAADQCPRDPETTNGFEDEDGCPDQPAAAAPSDADADGVPDELDVCPDEAEDMDGFEDGDGCPDDNDRDGIPDSEDRCPNEPEVVNEYADEDGCPDSDDQVRVVGDEILLDERIHFWTNSFVLRKVSHPLLERVARLLNDHPEYLQVEVRGHSDGRGDPGFNERLSAERAKAVMQFLIERGVDPDRLSAVGLGSSLPFSDRTDERAMFLNRRVEFRVTRDESSSLRGLPTRSSDAAPASPLPDYETEENPP
jgi:outer membrane protein OmpA-like peptidoglycan-associated protein